MTRAVRIAAGLVLAFAGVALAIWAPSCVVTGVGPADAGTTGPRPHPASPVGMPIVDGATAAKNVQQDAFALMKIKGPSPACVPPDGVTDPGPKPSMLWERPVLGLSLHDGGPVALGDYLFMSNGSLKQIDRRTGDITWATVAWSNTSDDFNVAPGADGLLYLFEPDLLAVDMKTHKLVRSIYTRGSEEFMNPPIVFPDGRVVIRDFWGNLIMYAPTANGSDYERVWTSKVGGGPVQDAPMVYDQASNRVFLEASDSASAYTVAVNVTDGGEAWRVDGGGFDLKLVGQDLLLRTTVRAMDTTQSAYRVQLLNRSDGSIAYDYGPSRMAAASPNGDRVYAVLWKNSPGPDPTHDTSQGTVTALDRQLKPLWTWTAPVAYNYVQDQASHDYVKDSTLPMPPVVADDGSVFVETKDCHVFALDRDGHLMWSDLHPFPFYKTHMVLDHGVLYATSLLDADLAYWGHGLSDVRAYDVASTAADGGTPGAGVDGGSGDAGAPVDGGAFDAGSGDGGVADATP